MKINNISAIRFASILGFRSGFVASDGRFKLNGEEIYRKGASLICKIPAIQYNSHFLFGKGFSNIHTFI